MNQSISLILHNEDDTQMLGLQLAKLPLSGCVCLSGDLGAGKTTLTRYWLRGLGHNGAVKSPTYTLVEPYAIVLKNDEEAKQKSEQKDADLQSTIKAVYHADFYRLQDPEELSFIGFDEYLEDDNALAIIEWASKAAGNLPEPVLLINLTQQDDDSRVVELTVTKAGERRLPNLSIKDLAINHFNSDGCNNDLNDKKRDVNDSVTD